MAYVPGIFYPVKFCALIPVFNEALFIGPLVQSLKEKGIDVIVMDDGSTDDSGSIAKKAGARVLRHDNKNGKGFTLQRGFKFVVSQSYDGVVTLDGDGQHAVEDIDGFLDKARSIKEPCIINGDRMSNSKGMPLVRYLTNRLMSGVISLACRQKISDTQCGYRYISLCSS